MIPFATPSFKFVCNACWILLWIIHNSTLFILILFSIFLYSYLSHIQYTELNIDERIGMAYTILKKVWNENICIYVDENCMPSTQSCSISSQEDFISISQTLSICMYIVCVPRHSFNPTAAVFALTYAKRTEDEQHQTM